MTGVGARNLARLSAPKRQGPGAAVMALGRLKTGVMNKTEEAYAGRLEERRRAGEVAWFRFEATKLRLADNTFYSPDFTVMLADGQLEQHEVKGGRGVFQDDAKAKLKIAAEQHPYSFFVCFPRRVRDGGGWDIEKV